MGFFDDLKSRVQIFQTECPLAFAFPRTALAVCTPEKIQAAKNKNKYTASMLTGGVGVAELTPYFTMMPQLAGRLGMGTELISHLPYKIPAFDIIKNAVVNTMQASVPLLGPILTPESVTSEKAFEESLSTFLLGRLIKRSNEILKECETLKTDDQKADCVSYKLSIDELNGRLSVP